MKIHDPKALLNDCPLGISPLSQCLLIPNLADLAVGQILLLVLPHFFHSVNTFVEH